MIIPESLYRQICGVLPIACVDLLITDSRGLVLLTMRRNEPAAGQWWFPGGRVFYKETREAAALRKLREECSLEPTGCLRAIGTYDLIFNNLPPHVASHGITTLFHLQVGDRTDFKLDSQSLKAQWRECGAWMQEELHPFVRNALLGLTN